MYPGVFSQSGADVSGRACIGFLLQGSLCARFWALFLVMAPQSSSRCCMNIHLINYPALVVFPPPCHMKVMYCVIVLL